MLKHLQSQGFSGPVYTFPTGDIAWPACSWRLLSETHLVLH